MTKEECFLYIKDVGLKILFAIFIFIIGWYLARVISHAFVRAMRRAKIDESVISFTNSLIKTSLRVIVIISCMAALGVNVASIVAAIGAIAVTAGLAMKDSLSNVSSGVLIVVNKLFRAGDHLETSDAQGTVKKVELMFTTLETKDGKEIIIPNAYLTSKNIINHTPK